jgi:(R,R)-butanediol dehydrogenase/meso-butanediol dehydrogenase/diacetyl reductase
VSSLSVTSKGAASSALVWEGDLEFGVKPVTPVSSRPGWIPIEVAYAGICGTDLHIVEGKHSRAVPGLVLGHEFSGRLAEPVDGNPVGTPVFVNPMIHCGSCDACQRGQVNVCRNLTSVGIDYPGAMTVTVFVPPENIFILPTDLPLIKAAIIEPVAVCARALRRGGVAPGKSVHIFGGGPIGCMIGLLSLNAGATRVTVTEPSERRRELAVGLGLEALDHHDVVADIVFNATSSDAVSEIMVGSVTTGGTVVVIGAYAKGTHPVDLLDVMFTEATMVGTRIYSDEDILSAIEILRDPSSRIDSIVTDTMPLRDAVIAFDKLRSGTALKILLEVGDPQ